MSNKKVETIIGAIEQLIAELKLELSLSNNEGKPKGTENEKSPNIKSGKERTLREIVKGRKFKNGQEQIAVIVGYYEKILGTLIRKDGIKAEWINAKITNKFNTEFILRAENDLIRVRSDGTYDLTQSGEDFFEKFLKNESPDTTSK